MADYRDWCGSCGNEINFGSHDPDCEYMFAERIAAKEERDFENAIREEYRGRSKNEIVDEARQLAIELRALADAQHSRGKKWQFLMDYLGGQRMELYKEFKEKGIPWPR
jgi:hypothetical protein